MARAAVATDLQPIDRLEEKIRQLVGMIDKLRADRARAVDEATRLQRELELCRRIRDRARRERSIIRKQEYSRQDGCARADQQRDTGAAARGGGEG